MDGEGSIVAGRLNGERFTVSYMDDDCRTDPIAKTRWSRANVHPAKQSQLDPPGSRSTCEGGCRDARSCVSTASLRTGRIVQNKANSEDLLAASERLSCETKPIGRNPGSGLGNVGL